MRVRTLAAVVVAAGLVLPLAAEAQRMGGFHHEDGMEMLHGLSLTDAQKDQVHAIAEGARAASRPAMEQMFALHEQMTERLLGGASIAEVTPLVRQEEALRDQLDGEKLAAVVKMRGVLTAAQLSAASAQHAKLAALHAQEHAVMGDE